MNNIAGVLQNLGDLPGAKAHYKRALNIFRQFFREDHPNIKLVLDNLASVNAIERYEIDLTIARQSGNKQEQENALGNLANTYLFLKKYPLAIELYKQALAIAEEIGDREGQINALGNLGNAYFFLEAYQWAIDFYEKALAVARKIDDLQRNVDILFNMSVSLAAIGKRHEAITLAEQVLNIASRLNPQLPI